MESITSPGSSRRARAPGNMAQVAHCLVDGCDADLSQCREYHRRHKVCEFHSKTPKVTIGGREQRFCQQCSRFHSLVEFDEEKRSCRKRLDGHNRRRRKPQPESLSRNSGLLFSSQQGPRLLSFGNPETFPSTTWPGVVNADNDMMTYSNETDLNYIVRQNSYSEASARSSYKGVNQFQFTLSTEHGLPEAPTRGLDLSSASVNSINQVVDSDRALSLLSSAPAVTNGFNHMVQPNSMHHLHYSSLGQYPFSRDVESKPIDSVTESQVSNNSNFHYPEMFQNGADESSTSGSQQTLTFMWE